MVKKLGRRAVVTFADKIINYPDLDMDFEVNFDTNSDGNSTNLKIYNLSDKTIDKLKKDTEITIKAGYKDDLGLLVKGIITNSKSKFEDDYKVTKISIDDNTKSWAKDTYINLTWTPRTKASKIAKDILEQLSLMLGDFSPARDIAYPTGKTFSTTAKKALEELARDTNSKLHISNGKVYFRPKDKPNREVLQLNKETGLIASPQKQSEEKWKIQSLLNYKIQADNILEIDSSTASGSYRVVKGKHTLSDFNTEAEVIKA